MGNDEWSGLYGFSPPLMNDSSDAERFRWLLTQPSSVQDAVLRPPIPPELLEKPEAWPNIIRATIDARRR